MLLGVLKPFSHRPKLAVGTPIEVVSMVNPHVPGLPFCLRWRTERGFIEGWVTGSEAACELNNRQK